MSDAQTITFDSGETIEIPACPERIYAICWGNGQLIEILFFDEPLEDEDPSDRIQLLITPADGEPRGWLMNVEDAICIIEGLAQACRLAAKAGIPVHSEEEVELQGRLRPVPAQQAAIPAESHDGP